MSKSRERFGVFIRPEYRKLLDDEFTSFYIHDGKYFSAISMDPDPPFLHLVAHANKAHKNSPDENFLIPIEFVLFVVSDSEEKDFGFKNTVASFDKQ